MHIKCRHLYAFLALLITPIAAHAAWPKPPLPAKTEVAEVSKHIVFNGLDMHALVFSSSENTAQVVTFYKGLWKGQAVVNAAGEDQIVGHKQGDYYITVQVGKDGAGSKGNIGIVDITSAPHDFKPGKGLPQPMGSKVFNDIQYPDDSTPARTVAMRNKLSPEQNVSYFSERLVADGWKPIDRNRCESDGCVMRYERGDSRMTLLMNSVNGQSQVTINQLNP